MNKFLLTFKDKNIEKDYQDNKLNTLQKPIFYWLLAMSFALNLFKMILDYTYYSVNNKSWMNLGFVLLVIVELILVCYKKQYIKYALIVSNLSAGLLQINFDENNTFPQEYYSYGSYYAMLSVVVYFMSDFPYSLFQVIIHLSMKICFTTIKSHRIDMLGIILGLITNVFLVLTLYICDWNSRRQFLLNMREVRWEESLPIIVKKPYYLFTYKDKNMSFQVNRSYNHEFFPYYNQDDCCGCNFRNFLRKCKVENNNLEIYLFDKRNENLDFDLSMFYWIRLSQLSYYIGETQIVNIKLYSKINESSSKNISNQKDSNKVLTLKTLFIGCIFNVSLQQQRNYFNKFS
ncbi:unnamed protein product [Paramecium primaurelia]|uniref:Transmembrane protein n=1 Tax=Paramecium primaurelia TaxID=5886 RepID=A0A8S1MM60_PARPR|nr:unnamed protein product [Paramecium primaurelia]